MKTVRPSGMIRLQKKVALVCFSNSHGGLELSAIRIAQAMVKKGVSVVVIVPHASPVEQRANEANLEVIAITPRWKYGDISAAVHFARVPERSKDRIGSAHAVERHSSCCYRIYDNASSKAGVLPANEFTI